MEFVRHCRTSKAQHVKYERWRREYGSRLHASQLSSVVESTPSLPLSIVDPVSLRASTVHCCYIHRMIEHCSFLLIV